MKKYNCFSFLNSETNDRFRSLRDVDCGYANGYVAIPPEELLLKDFCARLPYGVICKDDYAKVEGKLVQIGINYDMCLLSDDYGKTEFAYIPNCKPYLFPLSSMTEEQKDIFGKLWWNTHGLNMAMHAIDYLNKHHFDYRGLIPMGLAIDATGKNIY